MSAQHTPGPWEAKNTPGAGLSVHANVSKALGPRYSNDCPVYHIGNNACTMAIAYELWTQFPREEWDAMQQANARLIAAAPDLLEALMACVEPTEPGEDCPLPAALYNKVCAAIAKATGAAA